MEHGLPGLPHPAPCHSLLLLFAKLKLAVEGLHGSPGLIYPATHRDTELVPLPQLMMPRVMQSPLMANVLLPSEMLSKSHCGKGFSCSVMAPPKKVQEKFIFFLPNVWYLRFWRFFTRSDLWSPEKPDIHGFPFIWLRW